MKDSTSTYNTFQYFYLMFVDFNAGNTLIFQQFYAMLVKHFYYFTRFWMGIILAVVLPIFFVLLTLLIIKYDTTDSTTVTELTLKFPDLAEESSNITLFWAKFGNNFPIQFGVCELKLSSLPPSLSLSLPLLSHFIHSIFALSIHLISLNL